MKFNPKQEPAKRPPGWEKMWARDFTSLLTYYDIDTLYRMIAYTQSEKQQQYYIRPEVLLNRRESVLKDVQSRMEHKPTEWDTIWGRYLNMLGRNLKIEPTDLKKFMDKEVCGTCKEYAVDCDCIYRCPHCDVTCTSLLTIQGHILRDHPIEEQHPEEVVTFNIEGDDDDIA
jgi:hypothetical protein